MTTDSSTEVQLKRERQRFNQGSHSQSVNESILWSVLVSTPAYLAVWIVRAEIAWFPIYIWALCFVTTISISLIAWLFHRRLNATNEYGQQIYRGDKSVATATVSAGNVSGTKTNVNRNVANTGRNDKPESWQFTGVIVSAALLPWLIHFLYRWIQYANAWNYSGEALEMIAIATLQNITLALALISTSSTNRNLTITSSFFLMLFAIVLSSRTWVYLVAGVYGVMAIWWLMGDYWNRIQDSFVGHSRSSYLPIRGSVLLGATLFLCGIAFVTAFVSPNSIGLSGWLPTSGGKSWADPSARSGVGDGDMLVAARDSAFSFGPVESDLFIEDKQPSLYDMISEIDGLPPKKKKAESAVGIDAAIGKTNHEKLANMQGSSREFSTIRQAPNVDRKKLSDKDSPSLLYYSGPTPQRLAMETYEKFDGITWTHEDYVVSNSSKKETEVDPLEIHGPPVTTLIERFGKPWIQFRNTNQSASRYSDKALMQPASQPHWSGAIKIIRLVSPRIPTPDQLDAVHIDRIDRPEFFDRTPDGIAVMVDREQVPSLTTVRIDAVQRNLHSLRNAIAPPTGIVNSLPLQNKTTDQAFSLEPSEKVKELVNQWTNGIESSWSKIEAIEAKLHEEFVLDSQAIVPENSTDAVEFFLNARRGPAYLFATAAATMIRSLGHKCRLANGFYIGADTYDAASGQYLIGKRQLHWWPQVSMDGFTWISIEPTPGYLSPSEKWTFYQRCHWAWKMVTKWVQNHPGQLLVTCLVISLLYRLRIQILDICYSTIAQVMGLRSLEEKVDWSLWLLDRRAELAGCPRPPSKTQRQWYRTLCLSIKSKPEEDLNIVMSSIDDVLSAQDERLYSPSHRIYASHYQKSNQTKRLLNSIRMTAVHWTVARLREGNISLKSVQNDSSLHRPGMSITS